MKMKFYEVVLDCPDPIALADFYAKLTGWAISYQNDEYTVITPPGVGFAQYPAITFQKNEAYVPPVWPDQPGQPQVQAHLDFGVDDLAEASVYALACGAKLAAEQFSKQWTVMIDPVGHPFCLCLMRDVLEDPANPLL